MLIGRSAVVTVMLVRAAWAGDRTPVRPDLESALPKLAQFYLGKSLDHLGPDAKTQILGRWYLAYDMEEVKRHPSWYEFCNFRADGTADCSHGEGPACHYEIRAEHIVISCDKETRFLVFRVDGEFYIPSHEEGLVRLVRAPVETN